MKLPVTIAAIALSFLCGVSVGKVPHPGNLLAALDSPILMQGNDTTAYRDAAIIYHQGLFYMYYSLVLTEEDRKIYWYTAYSTSPDLKNWTKPTIITPKDQNLNFASPGHVKWINGEWILAVQTYPMPGYTRNDPKRFGKGCRVWIMRSQDLKVWSQPELVKTLGPDVPEEEMPSQIDLYLQQDKDVPGKWWCFFKQNGNTHVSWSMDLKNWNYQGPLENSGENGCVLIVDDEYVLFHSPGNGIGVMRSTDMLHWRHDGEPITLGQQEWPWCAARITAGYVADFREVPGVGKYVMFFHGMGPGKKITTDVINANCPIGIAWSDDLKTWDWPGKDQDKAGK